MGGAHFLVILPSSAIIILPLALSATNFCPPIGEGFSPFGPQEKEGGKEISFSHGPPPKWQMNRCLDRPSRPRSQQRSRRYLFSLTYGYVTFKLVLVNRVKTLYFRLGSCIFPCVSQKGFSEQNFAVNLTGVAP